MTKVNIFGKLKVSKAFQVITKEKRGYEVQVSCSGLNGNPVSG
jgi:hypothetical protein